MDSAEAKIGSEAGTAAHSSEPLPLRIKLLYGAPSFAGAAMIIPIFIHMPKFYADVVLVPLGYLAMAIAIARSLDALSDPLMGWISDHTHTRLGRRRPYMLVGAPLCGVAFFALLNPPASFTGGRAAIWFGVTFILYFLFHTVYVLPHYALGPELTQNYHDRSSLFAWRESFTILGTIVAAAAPGVMMQAFHMTERQVFFRLGIFFGVMLSVLYGLLVLTVKERPDFVARESNPLVPGVRRALRNRPFAILLGSYVVSSISGAIPATMMPFFNAYVIRPPNPTFWLSMLLLGYFAFAICVAADVGCNCAQSRKAQRVSRQLFSGHQRRRCDVPARARRHLVAAGADLLGRYRTRRRLVPDALDAGRRNRLRRALHRQAARGAVHRVLVDASQIRRDSERCHSHRGSCLARLHTQRRAGASGRLRDQGDLRAGPGGLLRCFHS